MKRKLLALVAALGMLFGSQQMAHGATQPTPNYKYSIPKWHGSRQQCGWNNRYIEIVNLTTYDQRFINWLTDTVHNFNELNRGQGNCETPLWFGLRTGGGENCGDPNTWLNKILVCGGGDLGGSWDSIVAANATAKKWQVVGGGLTPARFENDGARINVRSAGGQEWWTWSDHLMNVTFCHEVAHSIGLWHADYSCADGAAPIQNVVGHPTTNWPGLTSDRQRLYDLYTY